MIALDASVLIAVGDANDAHHRAAKGLMARRGDKPLVIGTLNLAEALVGPTKQARVEEFMRGLSAIGVTEVAFPADAATRLAHLRLTTRLSIPDCCVLLTAQQSGAAVATFDAGLRAAARSLGLQVLPDDEEPDPRS
ncbi:type II toxin-antitoxin system VapC family toxin [Nocardioides nitrophenolicus]|uniref:type II toxin-antitoxin system VapC family toxin n=1 Tax=Nocardioides nitrophenolicus TaxID=60489 RepID=UPI00195C2CE3|nr:type II toxin-antitoxin system VapC family toxin [Nocardioides nitrophenolicus]MBM7519419.1 putative nucleic acid-binding protein [Nocardioides nitrophenolicus]